jgi:hypothetical protein
VAATNTNPFPVLVALTGGTTTVIAVGGTTVATTTPANVVVPAGSTIAVTYSAAPSWVWSAAFAGASGNPLSSPAQLPIPPGGSAELFYTAAPTWTWNNYPPTSYPPGYSAYNTQAEGAGYDPVALMPYAKHSLCGLSNWAVGVTN